MAATHSRRFAGIPVLSPIRYFKNKFLNVYCKFLNSRAPMDNSTVCIEGITLAKIKITTRSQELTALFMKSY